MPGLGARYEKVAAELEDGERARSEYAAHQSRMTFFGESTTTANAILRGIERERAYWDAHFLTTPKLARALLGFVDFPPVRKRDLKARPLRLAGHGGKRVVKGGKRKRSA